MSEDLDPEAFRLPLHQFFSRLANRLKDAFQDYWSLSDEERKEVASGSDTFYIARAMKGHPDLRGMSGPEAMRVLREHDDLAMTLFKLPGIEVMDPEDVDVEFCAAWERVRVPMGMDPVCAAVEAASVLAPNVRLRTNQERAGRYALFLSTAAILQMEVARKPVYLPCRHVGEAMGCRAMTVSAWSRWAQDDGVLLLVRPHQFRGTGPNRASEFVVGLHRWRLDAIRAVAKAARLSLNEEQLDWTRQRFDEADH